MHFSIILEVLLVELLLLQITKIIVVAQASGQGAFLTPPWWGALDMSYWQETRRKTQDTLEGLCSFAGLGMLLASPGGAGPCG